MNEIRKIIDDVDAIIKINPIDPPLDLSQIKYFDDHLINTYLWALSKRHMQDIAQSNRRIIDVKDYGILLAKIDEIYEILEKI